MLTYLDGRYVPARKGILSPVKYSTGVEMLRVRALYDVDDLEGATGLVELWLDFCISLRTGETG